MGDGHGRGRPPPGHQSLRPAQRRGGQGAGPRGRRRPTPKQASCPRTNRRRWPAKRCKRSWPRPRLGDYVALQAYVQPTAETDAALLALRTRLRDQLKLATTVGYGPRFLHSTGQLHKGDAGNGLFIQFTADDSQDRAIPDEAGSPESSMSFGVLKMAQALGDKQALLDAGRRVIRFHLGDDVVGGLNLLAGSVT